MLNVLVAYERKVWQRGICAVLERRGVAAFPFALGAFTSAPSGDLIDVVVLEGGGNKNKLRDNLSIVLRRFPSSRLVLSVKNLQVFDLGYGHRMGISAVIDEGATPGQMLASIEAAKRGDLYVAGSVLRQGEEDSGTELQAPSPDERLSERESEVLGLVAKGYTNKEISKSLFISEKTVKNHMYSIFRKIGVCDRTKAALYALGGLPSGENGSKVLGANAAGYR